MLFTFTYFNPFTSNFTKKNGESKGAQKMRTIINDESSTKVRQHYVKVLSQFLELDF